VRDQLAGHCQIMLPDRVSLFVCVITQATR
jgi:hypothetical protein